MEIKQDGYEVQFDSESHTVICSGSFRLTGKEYASIMGLLNTAADAKLDSLNMDLTGLKFLNSSGINTLCKFVMRLRKNNVTQVKVFGNSEYAWQTKSLANFKKLLPSLELDFQ